MRGKPAPKRTIEPDLRYNDLVVERLINLVMRAGKKNVARSIVYEAFDHVATKSKKEALAVFQQAMTNVEPTVEVKSRRIGGANYQIPIEVRGGRREALAMRWIIDAARSKKGASMGMRLGNEILDASQKQGEAFKKKEDVRRMAEANRAFAHFAR